MLSLFGIHPPRLLIAAVGIGLLAAGLVVHGLMMTVLGGLLIVWAAVTFVAGRRRAG